MGDMHQYTHGKQLVKLAGLDIRLYESGSSIRQLPKISHVGSAYLRHWLSHYALRLVAHEAHLQSYDARRQHQSPGKGSGQRALMAVCDQVIRMIYRLLIDQAPYAPTKDQTIARYYAARRKAA
jgi:transposase